MGKETKKIPIGLPALKGSFKFEFEKKPKKEKKPPKEKKVRVKKVKIDNRCGREFLARKGVYYSGPITMTEAREHINRLSTLI